MGRIVDILANIKLSDLHLVSTATVTYSLTHSHDPGRREHSHTDVRVCIRFATKKTLVTTLVREQTEQLLYEAKMNQRLNPDNSQNFLH